MVRRTPLHSGYTFHGSGCLWSPHVDDIYYVHLGSRAGQTPGEQWTRSSSRVRSLGWRHALGTLKGQAWMGHTHYVAWHIT